MKSKRRPSRTAFFYPLFSQLKCQIFFTIAILPSSRCNSASTQFGMSCEVRAMTAYQKLSQFGCTTRVLHFSKTGYCQEKLVAIRFIRDESVRGGVRGVHPPNLSVMKKSKGAKFGKFTSRVCGRLPPLSISALPKDLSLR